MRPQQQHLRALALRLRSRVRWGWHGRLYACAGQDLKACAWPARISDLQANAQPTVANDAAPILTFDVRLPPATERIWSQT